MISLLSATSDIHYSLIEAFYTNPIFNLGLMILFAIIGGKLIEMLNFPKVTGYILMGILIGPSLFEILTGGLVIYLPGENHIAFEGVISTHMIHAFQVIRQVAIGFIFSISLKIIT